MRKGKKPSVDALIRRAVSLLLEIRTHRESRQLLPMVVAFLETLLQEPHAGAPPIVVSVRAVRLRASGRKA